MQLSGCLNPYPNYSNERMLPNGACLLGRTCNCVAILWPMKTMKPTRIALAYCRNSNYSTLLIPAKGQLKNFESKYGFSMCVGCCFKNYPKTRQGVGRYWMVHFHHAVVRDKADPIALHKTLMQISEFRDLCSHDVPFFDQWNALPLNARPHSSEVESFDKFQANEPSKILSIRKCEKNF